MSKALPECLVKTYDLPPQDNLPYVQVIFHNKDGRRGEIIGKRFWLARSAMETFRMAGNLTVTVLQESWERP